MRDHLPLSIVVLIGALALGAILLPQIASAWFLNLANVSLARAQSLPADSHPRRAELDTAKVRVERAEEFAGNPRLSVAQARVPLLRGDTAQAFRTFESADAVPSDAIAQFLWGAAAYASSAGDVAFVHWRSAGATEYFMQQALRAQDAHEWAEAERMARIAVGIEPSRAGAHYVLGDALGQNLSTHPAALSELDQALALTIDPETISTILSRKGELLVSQAKYSQALDLFAQARTVAPIDARPRTDYATTLLQMAPDRRAEAEALLTQVIGDSSWYTAAYIALSNIAASDGDLEGAEAWLQKGLLKNPAHPDLLVPLADLYVRENRVEPARQALDLAKKYETHQDTLREIADRIEKLEQP